MFSNKFYVTDHIEYNHPEFLIIPMRNSDIFNNAELNRKHNLNLVRMLQNRYPNKHVTITTGARQSLNLIMKHISSNMKDKLDVRIQTTSDNTYISSCVTSTIEKNANRWNREINKKNDVLLINHEFGYADNRLLNDSFSEKEIIEDCAYSFNSKYNNGENCGTKSPFAIFSLSKFFPIQFGGFLLSDVPIENNEDSRMLEYVENVCGFYFSSIEKWSDYRNSIKLYYNEVFKELGCNSYFDFNTNDVPGVYLFKLPASIKQKELKEFYNKRGVQCSIFYGSDGFFLPLNQYTTRNEVDYFADLFHHFIANQEVI